MGPANNRTPNRPTVHATRNPLIEIFRMCMPCYMIWSVFIYRKSIAIFDFFIIMQVDGEISALTNMMIQMTTPSSSSGDVKAATPDMKAASPEKTSKTQNNNNIGASGEWAVRWANPWIFYLNLIFPRS